MRIAFLFAGQGSQKVGMGADLYEKYPTFRKTLDEVDADGKIKDILFSGTAEQLSDTRNTQPCMVAFAVAITQMMYENGVVPQMVAGLSLGEYSALAAAGVFSNQLAVELVKFRGQAMFEAVEGKRSKMSAVLQLDRETLQEACDEASSLGIVEIANYNCPTQIVIGGEEAAVDKACELATEKGARRCVPLQVSGPFHTSLMKSAGDKLAERFKEIHFGDIKIPVIFNTTALPLQSGEKIADLLEKQVQSSVKMEDTIRYMENSGIDTIIEIGGGKVLSGFVKKTCKSIKTYAIDDVESFEATISELNNERKICNGR